MGQGSLREKDEGWVVFLNRIDAPRRFVNCREMKMNSLPVRLGLVFGVLAFCQVKGEV